VLYGINVGAGLILSAYLSPADFGVYFVVTSIIGLVTFLSDVGLAAALVQKKEAPTVAELRTTFTVQQILAFLIVGIVAVISPMLQAQHKIEGVGIWLLYALSFSFVFASLKTIPSILLERKLEFAKLTLPQIVETIVFNLIAVTLAVRGYGLQSYVYAVFARSIVGVITIYFLQQWPIGLAMSRDALKALLRFGAKFQLNDLLARLKDDLFVVVLGLFFPASQMGYISWAKKMSLYPYQFSVNSVLSVTFPVYSRLQDHPEKLRRAIEKAIYFISLFILPVLVGLSIMMYPLTQLFSRYQQWQPALLMLAFFCAEVAFSAISTPLTNTLNAIGKINETLKLMIMWTVLNWTVTPIMIHFFGYQGVAFASMLIGCTAFITIAIVKKYVQISFVDQIWRQLVACFVMGGVLWFTVHLWSRSYLWLGAGVLFGGAVYAATILLVGYKKLFSELQSLKT
jgi:O-antigen/teichoic acid export membrane protein